MCIHTPVDDHGITISQLAVWVCGEHQSVDVVDDIELACVIGLELVYCELLVYIVPVLTFRPGGGQLGERSSGLAGLPDVTYAEVNLYNNLTIIRYYLILHNLYIYRLCFIAYSVLY